MPDRVALPDKPEELAEFMYDEKTRGQVLESKEKLDEFLAKYTKGQIRNSSLAKELKQLTDEGWAEFAEKAGIPTGKRAELKAKVSRIAMSDEAAAGTKFSFDYERHGAAPNPHAPGAKFDGTFETFAKFLGAAHYQTLQKQGMGEELKAMTEGAGADGGFLVPEEFRAELLRMSLEQSVVRPRARVVPLTRETTVWPAIHETSHASNVHGGVAARWAAEAGDLSGTEDQPEFAQVRLTARKLYAWAIASNELLQDSAIPMEALIMALFPEAIAYFEDDAFLTGTGAGQPLGILNADALIAQAAETGQSAATVVWENIVRMYSRMLPQSLGRGVWYANGDIFPQLATMSLNVGTGGSAIWLNNGTVGPPMTILGRPVIFTEKAETLGTAGDLVFCDFSYYLVGDRQQLTVASTMHRYFETDRTAWRFIQRVEGRPWVTSVLTPRNGTNTVSPFVDVATRS